VVPWGYDVNRFIPNQQKGARILAVSRLFERKGIQYFLKALAEFDGRREYEVNIVGDGPYRQTLQKMASDLKLKIKFWGHLDNDSSELTHLFGISSIFVLPSDSENFPVVLLEAMSAELAIITTKATGCSEVVGETGILIDPGDVHAITKALVELTSNPDLCRRLGQAARKRVEAHFTWTIVANRYIELYKKHSVPL
jgi:glycosyltransferase involved in cell wall biosynthesis